jgi:hypothetical protein
LADRAARAASGVGLVTSSSKSLPPSDRDDVWWSDEREVERIRNTRSRSRRRGVLLLVVCGALSLWFVKILATEVAKSSETPASDGRADPRLVHVATRWDSRFVRGHESLGTEWRLSVLLAADAPLDPWLDAGSARAVSVGEGPEWILFDLEFPSSREHVEPLFSPEQWDEARLLDSEPLVIESDWMDEEARLALVSALGVQVRVEVVHMLDLGPAPRTNAVFVPTSD